MRVDIEVKRVRASVTQGEAQVYMNGHYVMSFGDTIEMVKDDAPYYGANIGGWASVKPDTDFIRGLLCHKYEEIYKVHEKIGAVLDVIESEETGDKLDVLLSRQRAYVMACGGYGNIREADEDYNDMNRELIAAFRQKHGNAYIGKVNIWGKEELEDTIAGRRSVFTEYVGEPLRNFACDFVVPVEDRLLSELIRSWNVDKTLPKKGADAAKITARVEEIGGMNFVWY